MRIHEVLEACIEYIAIDGVIGCHPSALQAHLAKTDPTIDDDAFVYIYTLLITHPSVRVVLATCPLPTPEGKYLLGTAPLPDDFNPPDATLADVDISAMYREGVRGRQLAYHLAGEEYLTSKQAIEEKKVQQLKARLEGKKLARGKAAGRNMDGEETPLADADEVKTEESELMTYVETDDGGQGEDKVLKSDLRRLTAKWGSRLRLRCTDEEIYFRLTGSHQKIPKITPVVFHILQLAARSREKGITAIELGPLVGASQGSMHYYMKVLLALGLCAKVPAVIHASITNLLLFHRFLDQNENYRAITKRAPFAGPSTEAASSAKGKERVEELSEDEDEVGEENDAGLDFGPLTEHELMAGHVVKERLTRVLDSPSLKNHLLRSKNLLAILGWKDVIYVRFRRALNRHITSLVIEGTIERLEVGPKAIRCLRLTKYNPDYRHNARPLMEPGPSRHVVSQRTMEEYATPFHPLGGVSMVMSIEHMVLKGVIDSGLHGLSIAEIKDQLCDLYKRSVDFMVARVEDVSLPPHLRLFAVCTAMESVGKERRLRLFGIAAYREVMLSQGQTVSDNVHPPTPPEAGRWADLSFRRFYDSQADLIAFVDQYVHGEDDVGWGSGAVKAKAKITGPKKNLGTKRGAGKGQDGADESPRVAPSKREFLYSNEVQTRGRPRKYIYVVDEQGKPNRRIIGQVLPDPALAPVWIYFSKSNKLVEAPPGYSGVGDVPEMTPAQMRAGKPPEWFDQFPKFLNETQKAKEAKRAKTKAKGKGKDKGKGKEQGKSPSKRKGKRARDEVAVEHGADGEDGRRKSKRTRKETSYKERPDLADSEESDEEIVQIEVDGSESTGGPGPSTEALRAAAVAENRLEAQPSPVAIDQEVQEIAPPTPQPKKRGRPRKDAVVELTAAVKETQKGESSVREAEPLPLEVISAPEEVLPSAGDAFDGTTEKQPSVEPIDEISTSVTDTPRSSKRARKKAAPEPIIIQPTETPRSRRRPGAAAPRSPTPASAPALPSTPLFSMPRDSSPETSPFLLPAEFTKVKGKGKKGKSKLVEETKSEPQEGLESPLPSNAKSEMPMTEAAAVAGPPDARFSVAPTLAVETSVVENGADRDSATPLREIAGPTFPSSPVVTTSGDTRTRTGSVLQMPKPQDTPLSSRSGRAGRVDLGMIRKMNEVCQALLEAGGVLTEMKLQIEHREWTARVAGTDVPSAPAVQYSMDRTFYRKTIALLIGDGRIKSTKAAVPTPTGRWVQTEVLYLSTLPQENVQAYIRTLASQTAQAMAASGKRRSATRIADANFSEVRVATPVRFASAVAKPTQMQTEDLEAVRRETLLKEPTIVAYLYGFKSGRWARARSLHTGIIQAMRDSLGATSIISTSPRIFALPLLFEELSAGTFFECVLTSAYDEDLEMWLRDPAKRQTKLKDMPKQLSPRGGFGSAAVKNKISGLLEAMCELKLLTPLNIEDPDRATLHVHSDALGADLHFGGADGFGVSAYYIAHEHAPVYHIASDVSGLLGILPLREDREIDAYWRAAQAACTEPDINMVEELDCSGPTTWPNTAPLTEVLELDVDLRKMLRAPVRWKHQIRLLPIQRRALDEAIDFRRGERIVTSREEVEKLAYDNALPVDFVEAQLDARARQALTRLEKRRETDRADRAEYRQKQERAKVQLQQKLEERRATARAAWEEKIKRAAEKAGIEFSQELSDFVRRQTLQATNRVELNDEAVLEGARLFKRTKERGTGMLPPTGTLPRLPPAPKFRKHQRRVPATKVVIPKGTRRRREWSSEDYELLIDAEAIITARAASRRGLGRSAMAQLFPNVSGQTFLNRVKKVLAEPGKQAYFDRLVPAWKDVWERYRGTPELPDEHPESTIEFDIKAHVKFLREKLNKNDLRSAYVGDTSTSTGSMGGRMINLPETVDELLKDHRIKKRHGQRYSFESFHDSVQSEDQRVASLALIPLVETRVEVPRTLTGKVTRSQGVLSASIKMIVATPSEVYDQPLGMELLRPWTDQEQKAEISRLVEEKVLLFVKTAAHTGRFYVFSQGWLQLCDGPFPQDLFAEAESASKRFDDPGEDGVEWPIVGTSGDIASLLNLVSSHEVDFGFDVDDFPTLQRSRETYNTRKLNDDSFEFKITVKLNGRAVTPAKIVPDPFASMSPTPWPSTRQPQPRGLRDIVDKVINAVKSAGPDGITKPNLLDVIGCAPETFDAALASVSSEAARRVFWAGYDTARLVSTDHQNSAWLTATRPRKLDVLGRVIRDLPAVPTRPRRWITINGELLHDEWDKAVRCVSGHLLARPGISESSLRAKLAVMYDRLELNEILQSLLGRGVARRAWTTEEEMGERVLPPVEATDVDEEQGVFWWPARGMVLA